MGGAVCDEAASLPDCRTRREKVALHAILHGWPAIQASVPNSPPGHTPGETLFETGSLVLRKVSQAAGHGHTALNTNLGVPWIHLVALLDRVTS